MRKDCQWLRSMPYITARRFWRRLSSNVGQFRELSCCCAFLEVMIHIRCRVQRSLVFVRRYLKINAKINVSVTRNLDNFNGQCGNVEFYTFRKKKNNFGYENKNLENRNVKIASIINACAPQADRITEHNRYIGNNFSGFPVAQHFNPLSCYSLNGFPVAQHFNPLSCYSLNGFPVAQHFNPLSCYSLNGFAVAQHFNPLSCYSLNGFPVAQHFNPLSCYSLNGFPVAQHFNPLSCYSLNGFAVIGIIRCNCSNVIRLSIKNRIIFKPCLPLDIREHFTLRKFILTPLFFSRLFVFT